MSLHFLRQAWLCVLVACLHSMSVYAETDFEVGVLQQIPALPVWTDSGESEACTSFGFTETSNSADMSAQKDLGLHPDSVQAPVDTLALSMATDSLMRKNDKVKLPKPQFRPNPQRALWLALVFPGAGQIYNRKYWKLPFIYGGFLGCAYALMWNQQMYRDYSRAYLDIMDDNPQTDSYLEILPPRYNIAGREDHFKKLFKRKKDFFRRNRDLSAFCFVGVYLLSVIDAYVDAQLSEFDITPDLSMSVEPAVIGNPQTLGKRNQAAYGVGCSFKF